MTIRALGTVMAELIRQALRSVAVKVPGQTIGPAALDPKGTPALGGGAQCEIVGALFKGALLVHEDPHARIRRAN